MEEIKRKGRTRMRLTRQGGGCITLRLLLERLSSNAELRPNEHSFPLSHETDHKRRGGRARAHDDEVTS